MWLPKGTCCVGHNPPYKLHQSLWPPCRSCQRPSSLQAFLWNNFLVSLMKQFSYEFPMWSNFSLSFPCEANFPVFSLVLAEVHRSKYHSSIASSTFQCRIIILFSRFHVKNRVLYTILKDQRWNCLLIIIQAQLTNNSCNHLTTHFS